MIRYTFIFPEPEPSVSFEVDELGDSSVETPQTPVPDWVSLERFRCKRCTLPEGSRRSCPAALSILPVTRSLSGRYSYSKIEVRVERRDVTYSAQMATQRAARPVIGLLLALSACPVMMRLRPMARFHVPFASAEHTILRFFGMHFVAQHLRQLQGLEPAWNEDGLLVLLDDLHAVNKRLADRIRAASEEDAAVNALIILDALAGAVEDSVENSLEGLRPFFSAYLTE